MPTYKYTAKAENGARVHGTAEAADDGALYRQLRTEGLFLLSSRETDATIAVHKLKALQLADFCRQLGTLLKAGVSLVRGLTIMAGEEGLKPAIKAMYEAMVADLRKGVSLSDSLTARGGAFPPLLISMVRCAEGNGNIDQTMLRMASHYEKEHRMQQQISSAMMYPAVLSVLIVLVVAFILTYIIPQFEPLFAEMEALPWATNVLLGLSAFLKQQWPLVLMGLALIVLAVQLVLRIPRVRLAADRAKLHLPLVGKLLRKIYTARFGRTLASLYASGMPIVTALQTAQNTVGNTYIAAQFENVLAMVRSGDSLSNALSTVDGFAHKLQASILVGEETGALDSMLTTISDNLDYEAEVATKRLVALLEPIMIIIMAILIGFILIAIVLPIYQSYAALEGSAGTI